jgi:hypothetical protein
MSSLWKAFVGSWSGWPRDMTQLVADLWSVPDDQLFSDCRGEDTTRAVTSSNGKRSRSEIAMHIVEVHRGCDDLAAPVNQMRDWPDGKRIEPADFHLS